MGEWFKKSELHNAIEWFLFCKYSTGVLNNNFDNKNSDYILRVKDVITNTNKNK